MKPKTKLPWELVIEPGFKDESHDPDSEDYCLATAKIVSKVEKAGGKAWNEKTKKHDKPIYKEVLEIPFDDRKEEQKERVLADIKFIMAAVEKYK
jgi:histidinol dehydrogenase